MNLIDDINALEITARLAAKTALRTVGTSLVRESYSLRNITKKLQRHMIHYDGTQMDEVIEGLKTASSLFYKAHHQINA